MKGLQGERLRQAFKYLDADQDGFIRPEHFKRIILVSRGSRTESIFTSNFGNVSGTCWTQVITSCY